MLFEKRALFIERGGLVSLMVDESTMNSSCSNMAFSHSKFGSCDLFIVRLLWKVV